MDWGKVWWRGLPSSVHQSCLCWEASETTQLGCISAVMICGLRSLVLDCFWLTDDKFLLIPFSSYVNIRSKMALYFDGKAMVRGCNLTHFFHSTQKVLICFFSVVVRTWTNSFITHVWLESYSIASLISSLLKVNGLLDFGSTSELL